MTTVSTSVLDEEEVDEAQGQAKLIKTLEVINY